MENRASQLAELVELHIAGILSEEELVSATARVLSNDVERTSDPPPSDVVGDRETADYVLEGTRAESALSTEPVGGSKRNRPRWPWIVTGACLALPTISFIIFTFVAARPRPSSPSESITKPTESRASQTLALSTAATPLSFDSAAWPRADDYDLQPRLIRACGNSTTPRCRELVLRLGGSEEAIEFFESNGLFLVGTYSAGSIDIGFVAGPLGANSVATPLVLSDTAGVISPDQELADMTPIDRTYRRLVRAYPNLTLSQSEGLLEPPELRVDGSIELTYQYPLYDGCRACGQPGSARLTLTFSPEGALEGSRPVATCGVDAIYAGLSAPFCPAATIDPSTPEQTSVRTPEQAIRRLIQAWEGGDAEAASEVASAAATDFLWAQPASVSFKVRECFPVELSDEYWCSLSGLLNGFAVVAETVDGYYVAVIQQAE